MNFPHPFSPHLEAKLTIDRRLFCLLRPSLAFQNWPLRCRLPISQRWLILWKLCPAGLKWRLMGEGVGEGWIVCWPPRLTHMIGGAGILRASRPRISVLTRSLQREEKETDTKRKAILFIRLERTWCNQYRQSGMMKQRLRLWEDLGLSYCVRRQKKGTTPAVTQAGNNSRADCSLSRWMKLFSWAFVAIAGLNEKISFQKTFPGPL